MKTDRRVLKTEQALESALLKLMRGKSIDQITTTELCREAGINRNTFYAHYPNPTSLLERVEDEFIKVIVGIIDDTVKDQGYSMLLQRVFEAIIEHKALSLVLLSRNGRQGAGHRVLAGTRHRTLPGRPRYTLHVPLPRVQTGHPPLDRERLRPDARGTGTKGGHHRGQRGDGLPPENGNLTERVRRQRDLPFAVFSWSFLQRRFVL